VSILLLRTERLVLSEVRWLKWIISSGQKRGREGQVSQCRGRPAQAFLRKNNSSATFEHEQCPA
jgi:hypothetical protein